MGDISLSVGKGNAGISIGSGTSMTGSINFGDDDVLFVWADGEQEEVSFLLKYMKENDPEFLDKLRKDKVNKELKK